MSQANAPLPHGDLLQLKRWNTPTIYNGWEQITKHDQTKHAINFEETRDFMPQMGPMVGYAVTLVVEPSNPKHREANVVEEKGFKGHYTNAFGTLDDMLAGREYELAKAKAAGVVT